VRSITKTRFLTFVYCDLPSFGKVSGRSGKLDRFPGPPAKALASGLSEDGCSHSPRVPSTKSLSPGASPSGETTLRQLLGSLDEELTKLYGNWLDSLTVARWSGERQPVIPSMHRNARLKPVRAVTTLTNFMAKPFDLLLVLGVRDEGVYLIYIISDPNKAQTCPFCNFAKSR
jgi:hypothetical protein